MNKKIRVLKNVFKITFFLFINTFIMAVPNFEIQSDAAVLMDAETGQVLYEKNMNKIEYPASITKIMTGLLALENCNLDEVITMNHEGVFSVERDSSHIALNVGEQISMRDALYALAIQSANDAANGIGIHISGSLEEFAKLMNKRAQELGAVNTNFVTANGLHDYNHYTTAYDMALFMKAAIKTPYFNVFFNKKSHEIMPTNMQDSIRYLHNKNGLLNGKREYEGLIASKTGWTTEAKHTLVTAARRGDRTLIVVALNSVEASAKYEDTMRLFDYGFNEFNELHINKNFVENKISENENTKYLKKMLKNSNFEITRLLNKDLNEEDVLVNFEIEEEPNAQKNIKFSFNTKNNPAMYSDLGAVVIKETKDDVKSNSMIPILKGVFKTISYIMLFLIGFIVFKKIVMKFLRYKYKKRKTKKNK